MAQSEVLVINDYNGGSLERRTRTSASGTSKSRYTITMKSEPLLIQTSASALGAGPAMAIRDHLKQRISDISETASPATIRARKSALSGVVTGESWAMKRYSGGKLGTRAPARSDKLFHDSGRFIESIAVRAAGDDWVINIAANRLDPSTFNGGEAAMARMIDRLRELVPEWGDASKLVDVLSVQRAIRTGLGDALQKANERGADLKMDATVGRLLRMVA
jgi:hypothetical protein